ncbi:Puromycin-sensitive aminopeptidase [Smittium mucronatum]|uniref:Aminopeptidase n=1 Tax=Smittium mucronatum TaxID=133383 RepID=A0A1R0H216_9FUNG|nr:Puromycin-sensitive aminopeptidase [Smittium mucronatum]
MNIKPKRYDLTFAPDLDNFIFSGNESLHFEISLKINDEIITINSDTVNIDQETQTMNITLSRILRPKDNCVLDLEFSGKLKAGSPGFHIYRYFEQNENYKAADTELMTIYARSVFPCLDQPDLKAVFSVTIITKEGYQILSNGRMISRTCNTDTKLCENKFEDTPEMSTYLLALAVGIFDFTEEIVEDNFNSYMRLRIYTPPGKLNKLKYLMEYAKKSFEFFSNMFGVPLPIMKLDHLITVGHGSAMENWGLIIYDIKMFDTYKEGLLKSSKLKAAELICHQTAHQWLGNLVTIKLWDDIWLSEGITSWATTQCISHLFPDQDPDISFLLKIYPEYLSVGKKKTSLPLTRKIKTLEEISSVVDNGAHLNGEAISTMIANILGKDEFLRGVNNYLKKFKNKNADTDDFFGSLFETSGIDVKDIFESWTKNPGYPIIYISETEDCSYLNITQERFLRTKDGRNDDQDVPWKIPILLSTHTTGSKRLIHFIRQRTSYLHLPDNFYHQSDYWININSKVNSLVRVKYNNGLLESLLNSAQNGHLQIQDKIAIILDNYEFAKMGIGKTSQFLNIANAFKEEKNLSIWKLLVPRIRKFFDTWYKVPNVKRDDINRFIVCTLSKILEILDHNSSFEDDTYDKLKNDIVRLLALSNHYNTVEKSRKIFDENKFQYKDIMRLDELKATYFSVGLSYLCDNGVENVAKEIGKYGLSPIFFMPIQSLGYIRDENMLNYILDAVFSKETDEEQALNILSELQNNTLNGNRLLKLIVYRSEDFKKKFKHTNFFEKAILSFISNQITENDAISARYEFSSKGLHIPDQSFYFVLEKIKAKSAWISRDMDDVLNYLSQYVCSD